MVEHGIKEGQFLSVDKEVSTSDTMTNKSSSLNFLLSTPAIMEMLILQSTEMLDHLLPDGLITVGKRIELTHVIPVPVGAKISLKLTVKEVEDTRILMDFEVQEETRGLACSGLYERQIVNARQLLETAYLQNS